jgi:hypothetical protein
MDRACYRPRTVSASAIYAAVEEHSRPHPFDRNPTTAAEVLQRRATSAALMSARFAVGADGEVEAAGAVRPVVELEDGLRNQRLNARPNGIHRFGV